MATRHQPKRAHFPRRADRESHSSTSRDAILCLLGVQSEPTEIEINGTTTRVMVEQLAAVDPQIRLGEFAGRLAPAELHAVNTALLAVLGLD